MSVLGSVRGRLYSFALGLSVLLVGLELGLRLAGAIAYPAPSDAPDGSSSGTGDLPVVLCVGDSHTAGRGHNSWPARLDRLLNPVGSSARVRVVNVGLAGANTALIRAALPSWLDSTQPDVVVIAAGTANHTNFVGYGEHLGTRTWLQRLDEALYHLRVYRLIRYATVARDLPGPLNPEVRVRVRREGAYEDWRTLGVGVAEVGQVAPGLGSDAPDAGSLDLGDAQDWLALCTRVAPDGAACRDLARKVEGAGLLEPSTGYGPARQEAARHRQNAVALVHGGLHDAALDRIESCILADPYWVECYDVLGKLHPSPARAVRFRAFVASLAGTSPVAASFTDAWQALDGQEDWQREATILSWVASDLAAVLDHCEARGIPVILHSYPVPDVVNPVMRELAMERGVPWVDHLPGLEAALARGVKTEDLLLPDRHCALQGNDLVAQDIAAALDRGAYLGARADP